MLAGVYAVEAIHAPAVIYLVVIHIDARRLAILFAEVTIAALGSVEERTENRKSGDEAQDRSHRADGVAIRPAVAGGQKDQHRESDRSDDECRQTPDPHLFMLECKPTGLLGNPCAKIVAPKPYGREKILGNAAERAVRSNECRNRAEPGYEKYDENHQHAISQPFFLGRPAVVLLMCLSPALE